jgi:hypothetical protein
MKARPRQNPKIQKTVTFALLRLTAPEKKGALPGAIGATKKFSKKWCRDDQHALIWSGIGMTVEALSIGVGGPIPSRLGLVCIYRKQPHTEPAREA